MSDRIPVGTRVRNTFEWEVNSDISVGLEGVISRNDGPYWPYEVDFPGTDKYGFELRGIPMDHTEFEVLED